MFEAICLGLFSPLAGFLILLASSSWIGRRLTGWIACSTIFLSFLCFSGLLYVYNAHALEPLTFTLYDWIPVKGIDAKFALKLDPLSLLMTMIITGVGFLIHVYSNGYMDHDRDYARYFACMNLFVFAMLLLVLAANLLVLFVGWEGVGLASYLLIGFYYTKPSAAKAATKAFVVNRIGDWGFLIGILLTLNLFGTTDFDAISSKAASIFAIGAPILTLLTFLYFWGAVGKSAQLPLYSWLPDAMEGPTPVSALIHAATMVTAGVYLIVRMHDVFMLTPATLYTVGAVGGVTSLFAALCAVGQTDLKRVLAYSTVSQLGLMFLACGVGGFYAAMFHLTTHAFVKATLFLAAGNVIHMLGGITQMEKMGGLAKVFTKTHWLFLIGTLALSGIPPFAAFFSKDLILEEEFLAGYNVLYIVGLAASILTGFYLTRAYCLTFLGPSRTEEKVLKEAKEAPQIMVMPVILLAFFSMVGGFLGFEFGKIPVLERFLGEIGITLPDLVPSNGSFFTPEMLIAILGAFFGVGISAYIYTHYAKQLEGRFALLHNAFYVDDFYNKVIVAPAEALSRFVANVAEPKVFDGSIHAVSHTAQGAAGWLQQVQSGQIRSYIAWMVAGMAALIVFFVFW